MSAPKKQHYVQRAYLSGFTGKSGKLHVFDRIEQRSHVSTPKASGYTVDFYTLDEAEYVENRYHYETVFLKNIEDKCLRSVHKFSQNTHKAARECMQDATLYMATAMLRTPKARKLYSQIHDRMVTDMHRSLYENDAFFHRFCNLVEQTRTIDRGGLRRSGFAGTDLKDTMPKNKAIYFTLQSADKFAEYYLRPLRWSTIRKPKYPFITSDFPLCCYASSDEIDKSDPLRSPSTVAVFPVSKSVALVGMGKRAIKDRAFPTALLINGLVALMAERHVYSDSPDFAWQNHGALADSREYLKNGVQELTVVPSTPALKEYGDYIIEQLLNSANV